MGYNERLFKNCLRKWFHMARFRYLESVCLRYSIDTSFVLELGCFDARSLEFIVPLPVIYHGYDANWEGGLEIAKKKFPEFKFTVVNDPSEIIALTSLVPTLIVSLETLEHIPVEILNRWLLKLGEICKGKFVVTVPNEKGVLFLAKYIVKRFIGGGESYTLKELFYATTGQLQKIERCQHKGFDYIILHQDICKYFHPIKMEGVQFPFLPLWLNLQIGMVFERRK